MADLANQKNNKATKPTAAKPAAKTATKAVKSSAPQKKSGLAKWWAETIGELRKVTWPTKEEAWHMTKVVIVVVVLMAIFLGLVDFGFSKLVGLVIG